MTFLPAQKDGDPSPHGLGFRFHRRAWQQHLALPGIGGPDAEIVAREHIVTQRVPIPATRRPVLACISLAITAITVACSSHAPQSAQRYIQVTSAYLAANPVPQVPGMIAGIVTEQTGDVAWFCHQGRGSSAVLAGNCGYWAGTMLTAAARTVIFTCGSITGPRSAWQSCTSATREYGLPGYVPEPGDYVYVPGSRRVSRAHNVRIIRLNAFDVWDPGPGRDPGVPTWCFPPKSPPAKGC